MRLRRGFALSPGERTLIVEDVVTTGGSALELWELAGAAGTERLGVAALIDRSAGASLRFPLRSVLTVRADSWAPEECPFCRDGLPLDSPGSHHLTVT